MKTSRTTRGRDSYRRGWRAEVLAAIYLLAKGYIPRAIRYRAHAAANGGGEVDLIVQKGNLLVAVEVKARPDRILGHESMNDSEWRRRAAAMDAWQRRKIKNSYGKNLSLRFDLIVVTPYFQIQHLESAWQPAF